MPQFAAVETKVLADVTKAKTAFGQLMAGGLTAGFFNFMQGRATAFAIGFFIMLAALVSVAIWGFIHGKDLTSLASVITSCALAFTGIQAMVFGHSCKEDWNAYKHRQLDIAAGKDSGNPNT